MTCVVSCLSGGQSCIYHDDPNELAVVCPGHNNDSFNAFIVVFSDPLPERVCHTKTGMSVAVGVLPPQLLSGCLRWDS